MESFLTRYRNLVVLLAVLLAQLIGLAVQVRRPGGGARDPRDAAGVRLIRLWADAVVAPPERLFQGVKMGAAGMWQNYLDLRGVRQQNRQIQQTVDRLRLEQAELLEDAKQGERLQALVGFEQKYVYTTLAAQVIGTSGSDSSRVFYLNKGADEGLQRDMAVMTPDGIVGKVREVYPHTAQVLAINDPSSGAGVILETTRIRGILRGNADGRLQVMDILRDDRIKPGEKVLTAGGDLIFPRGLPVGTVTSVVPDPDQDSFIDVIVEPAAHLDRLDEVLVITSTQPRFPPQEQQDMAVSEALKGADAAGLQAAAEQQKESQIMAERLPGLTDPNAPVAPGQTGQSGQAGQGTAGQGNTGPGQAAPPAPKLLQPRHPDAFSPPAAVPEGAANSSSAGTQPISHAAATPGGKP